MKYETAAQTGNRLSKNENVRTRIAELVQDALKSQGITPEYIISKVKGAIESAENKPIVSRVSGEIVGYDSDGRTILQGCELLAKICGMMTEAGADLTQPMHMSAVERNTLIVSYFKQHKIVLPGYTTPEDIIIDAPKAE